MGRPRRFGQVRKPGLSNRDIPDSSFGRPQTVAILAVEAASYCVAVGAVQDFFIFPAHDATREK
jgi:hypothetical protein